MSYCCSAPLVSAQGSKLLLSLWNVTLRCNEGVLRCGIKDLRDYRGLSTTVLHCNTTMLHCNNGGCRPLPLVSGLTWHGTCAVVAKCRQLKTFRPSPGAVNPCPAAPIPGCNGPCQVPHQSPAATERRAHHR